MVTVIIPTYKRANYIKRAINSVLNQTYQDFELIIVDDNDSDSIYRKELEEVMKEYEDNEKIKYIKHKKNQNGAVARNTGIKEAKGDYITFLDDDDFYLKDRLMTFVNILDNNKDYNSAYSSVLIMNNNQLRNIIRAEKEGNLRKEILSLNSVLGTGSNLFFRTSELKKINGFNENFLRFQDLEVLVRYFNNNNKIYNIDEILVVKDNSSRINYPLSSSYKKYDEYFIDYFKNEINMYDDMNQIYYKHYYNILKNAIYDNNKSVQNQMIDKLNNIDKKNIKLKILRIKIIKFLSSIKVFKFIYFKIKNTLIKNKLSNQLLYEIKRIK